MKQNIENYGAPLPAGKREYMMHYGEHFSKAAAKFAIDEMKKSSQNGDKIKMKSLEEIDEFLSAYGVTLKNDKGYDKVYLYAKGMADFLGSSIPDEMHLAKYIKDVLDDEDGYEGMPFVEWYHKVLHLGIPVMWEDIM